jgi:AAA15 family ATPase/GTPase
MNITLVDNPAIRAIFVAEIRTFRKMLIRFTAENYLSIKNATTLDLSASSIKELEESNVIHTPRENLLKCLAIYGANASGKSNLLKALIFVRRLILNSAMDQECLDDVIPFLLDSTKENQPSKFELVLLINSIRYRYYFEVDNQKVFKEQLYYSKVNKEYLCFDRTEQEIIVEDKFAEGKGIEDKTRYNALFLSVVSQFNGTTSMAITKWINEMKYVFETNKSFPQNYSLKLFESPIYRDLIKKYLLRANLGFLDLETRNIEIPEGFMALEPNIKKLFFADYESRNILMTTHMKYDSSGNDVAPVYFDMFKSESLGTQKYFAMSGLIIDALLHGKTLIIDELDARLHPVLCQSIIELFNSKNNNVKGAQLIFVAHNTSFLSKNLLRRDQICLAEKDSFGNSSLTSLAKKKVRSDEAYEKNYLAGEYRAIPLVEDFNLF